MKEARRFPGQPPAANQNVRFGIQEKRLEREAGQAVVQNVDGLLRYMYDDGSLDLGSKVNERVPHVVRAPQAEHAGEVAMSQAVEVPESARV